MLGEQGYSLVVVRGLLVVVASLAVGHRLWGTQASVVVVRGLSCLEACQISVPGPGIKPVPPHWQVDSYPLDHQGSPSISFQISLK